jgi:hypothetical protein
MENPKDRYYQIPSKSQFPNPKNKAQKSAKLAVLGFGIF